MEDSYSRLMNHPPKKQVPVGSNHQADIPECIKEELCDRSKTRTFDKLMGNCIIPMPESDIYTTGQGRKQCLCFKDSFRCVPRHIMEARETLIEEIGYKSFKKLGFFEMGEEVSSLWSEEEEDLFHKVVYSNPASLGRDFWKRLKETFLSRTMKELVGYYFNVFILRRRRIQNWVRTLDVDSDDDEWRIEYDEEEEETNDEESRINDCVEDDSCMSFEFQDSNLIFSKNSIEDRECPRSGDDSYSFDCWNKKYDLLPTSNIVEIFGEEEWGFDDDDDDTRG